MVNPFNPVARIAALFLLLGGAACTENASELTNLLDREGTIRGHVTLDGTAVAAGVLATGGANAQSLLITTDASGLYERVVTAGDWHLLGLLPGASCSDAMATVAGGAEVTRDIGCTPLGGAWTKFHHQISGTCNDPVPDFEASFHFVVRIDGSRTDLDLVYEGGNENTTVKGTVDPETRRFTGKSGRDDAGNGVVVEEGVEMTITRATDGALSYVGQSVVRFLLLSGALICTKTFDINGRRL